MNAAQIHLALNHAPLFLSIAGSMLLAFGLVKKNNLSKDLASYFLIIAAVSAVPVFLTGEGTEELIENLSGVNKAMIEEHEEMANISFIIIIATGIITLAGMIFKKREAITRFVFGLALLLSLASFITMAQTAHLGGLIRHSELQNGTNIQSKDNDNEEESKPGNSKGEVGGKPDSTGKQKTEFKDDDD